MALPFLPSSVDELPARRFVLFVDNQNQVQKMDESVKTADGVSFTGEWISPSLNRGEPSFLWNLKEVQLFYTAEATTTITLEASPDGGATWMQSRTVQLTGGTNELQSVNVALNVTGDDVRIRALLDTDVLVNLLGYRPRLMRRGEVRYDN